MDEDGPIFGSVVPLQRNWSDVVVAPGGDTWYTIDSNNVSRWDASTRLETPLPAPTVEGIPKGYMVGATWDTTRNQLVVASLTDIGYLYGYLEASNQWNLISTLGNVDLRSITDRKSV